MSDKIEEICKKCRIYTIHRFVNDSRGNSRGYYSCSNCSEDSSKKHRNKYWLRYLAQKANSRKRPRSVKITEDMLKNIYEKQEGRCALTGIPFNQEIGGAKPSLDRIDSSLGYIPENLQLVIRDINKIKREFPIGYFYALCKMFVDNYDLRNTNKGVDK